MRKRLLNNSGSCFLFIGKPAPLKVKVTMRLQTNYHPLYSDIHSPESRDFIDSFRSKVEPFLGVRLSGFRSVEVTGLSNGSLMVRFNILLEQTSNATKDVIVATLALGNSTRKFGFVVSGEITVDEFQDTSTKSNPTTNVLDKGKSFFR